ncbi:hypothetical protein [Szabonella alba]|uniref:Uncharacterized protein n=1 Tax=Szabonella alba TaxID=2804194 RepID=A0A8K0VC61_9RHOB|nr:hypothetical protein [Szabonella alba]MBL4918306.1 hypothetical protein [Szabonella alba]
MSLSIEQPQDLCDQFKLWHPDRLVVAAEGNILREHTRVIERSHKLPPKSIYDWRHYLAVLQWMLISAKTLRAPFDATLHADRRQQAAWPATQLTHPIVCI